MDLRDTSCGVGWPLININVDKEIDDFIFRNSMQAKSESR
jgi:hypothetical protein